ncbi:Ig-like domain-containing protein [Chromobacterium sp. IIBBL 290-4]|uniref:Ig-like domain-containing protein n=1 Tax=Chromobacterium sp. IIBBL 290-4 TaxID=2953890 RepID=UPI0020B6E5E4|nr:Ig-like domain-containing protein [Chromobacterium sp. IIBBL 290-4]UTH74251.1 Ig-like domain-containing protein [Chromobacterium sp. IIBBL 290-4]
MFKTIHLKMVFLLLFSMLWLPGFAWAAMQMYVYDGKNAPVLPVQYINAKSGVAVLVETGLEKKAVVDLAFNGAVISSQKTDLAAPGNVFKLGNTNYVGFELKFDLQAEGTYTFSARILDKNNTVISSESKTVVVDRKPPSMSEFFRKGPYRIYGSGDTYYLSGVEISEYGVDNVTDENGIADFSFFLVQPNGSETKLATGAWDGDKRIASVKSGGAYLNFPLPVDAKLRPVIFRAVDKAGNIAEKRYNMARHDGGAFNAEVVGLFDPARYAAGQRMADGEVASRYPQFVPYTPGMPISGESLKLLARMPLKEHASADLILGRSFAFPGWAGPEAAINGYVYQVCEPNISEQGNQTATCAVVDGYTWSLGWLNWSVKITTTQPPVIKSAKYVANDGQQYTSGRFNRNTVPKGMGRFIVEVEPRAYTQAVTVAKGGNALCTLSPGQTVCTYPFAFPESGTSITRGWELGGSVYDVANPKRAITDNDIFNFMYDLDDPLIEQPQLDESAKTVTVTARDVAEGILWGTVNVSKVQLRASNENSGEVRTLEPVKVNQPVTGGREAIFSFSSLQDATYLLEVVATDNYGNVAVRSAGKSTMDNTPPVITVAVKGAAVGDAFSAGSIDDLTLTANEPINALAVTLTSPEGLVYSMPAVKSGDNQFRIGYVPLLPTEEGDKPYQFRVVSSDLKGNEAAKEWAFSYKPPRVGLLGGLESNSIVMLPVSSIPYRDRKTGTSPLTTEPVTILGTPIQGKYDIRLRFFPDTPADKLKIAGTVLGKENPELMLNGYDFSLTNGSVSLPVMSAEAKPASGRLLITSYAPNFPVYAGAVKVIDATAGVEMAPQNATAVRSIESISFLTKTSSPYCALQGIRVRRASGDEGRADCLITLPDAKELDIKKVQDDMVVARLLKEGSQGVAYQVSFFIDGKLAHGPVNKIMPLTVIAPNPLQLALQGSRSPETPKTVKRGPASGVGFAVAKSPHSVPFVVELSGDVLKKVEFGGNRSERPATYPILLKAPELWQKLKVSLKGWYVDAPDLPYQASYELLVVPSDPVLLLERKTYNSVSDALVSGAIGKSTGGSRDGLSYDPAEFGQRDVWVQVVDLKGKEVKRSEPVKVTGSAFVVNLGKLPADTYYLTAYSRVRQPDGQEVGEPVSSSRVVAVVNNGSTLASRVTGRRLSGAVPFLAQLSLILEDPKRFRDVGAIQWLVSADGGAAWADAQDMRGKPPQGTDWMLSLPKAGKTLVKAKVLNRYSGEQYETAPVEVVAYHSMKLHIAGPNATVQGYPVSLTASNEQGVDADYRWEVSRPGGKVLQTASGPSLTIDPKTTESLTIKLIGVDRIAPPSDAAAPASAYQMLRVQTAKLYPASISGPRLVEVGKRYVFKAVLSSPFGRDAKSELTQRGEWVLPDGRRIEGEEVEYTPKEGDKGIGFESWFKEMPNVKATAVYSLQTWTYKFPEFKLTARAMTNQTPLTVNLSVSPKTPFVTLGGDKLSYEWAVPEGVTQLSVKDGMALLSFPKAGVFQPSVTVKDSRGNQQILMTEAVRVDVGQPIGLDFRVAVEDKWQRAPTTAMVQIMELKVPQGDRYAKSTIYVNGYKQAETQGTSAMIKLDRPGETRLSVVSEGVLGSTGRLDKTLTLKEPAVPDCQLKSSGNSSGLSVAAKCEVSEGYVVGYKWRVNGIETGVKNATIWLSAQQVKDGIRLVELEAATDKGKSATFSLTP